MPGPNHYPSPPKGLLLQIFFLAGLYFLVGRWGIQLAIPPGVATAVWFPSGLALAFLLGWGNRLWPGVWLGSFLVNAFTLYQGDTLGTELASLAVVSAIATGSTLQAVLGAVLIRRRFGLFEIFDRVQFIFVFIGISLLICIVAPSIGTFSLFAGNFIDRNALSETWLTWWSGDLVGIFLVLPLILIFRKPLRIRWTLSRTLEFVVFGTLLTLISWALFQGKVHLEVYYYPLTFAFLPFLLWGSFRFGQRGVALSIPIISGWALWGAIQGHGPFLEATRNETLLLLQSFVSIISLTGLALAAAFLQSYRAERHFLEGEKKMRTILDNALDAVVGMDADGIVNFWSPQAETIFGWNATEALGRRMSEMIIPEKYRSAHEAGLKRFLQTGIGPVINRRIEIIGLRRDGEEFPVELAVSALDLEGKHFFSAFIRDITMRKRGEEDLKRSNQELQRISQLKSEFASIVSHELRTPLTVIKECISMIRDGADGPVTENQEQTLGMAQDNVDRLVRLINNVLDYEKLESGKMEMSFERSNLNELIEKVVIFMRLVAKKKRVRLEKELPLEPVYAICDDDKIKELVINLVDNSLKYTPEGGEICLRLKTVNHSVQIEVEDEGMGIQKEDQEKIFEIFSRASTHGIVKIGGSGVGLAVCKLIVDQHGGTISVHSIPGEGTRFTVEFPNPPPEKI